MLRITFTLHFMLLVLFKLAAQTIIVPFGSDWKYLDNGTDQTTTWRATSFNDGNWEEGPGKLGYGISDASTVVSYGTNAKKKYITTYFRKSIAIDASAYTSYTANVKRDDGVVVYVNGSEVYRNNMPTGTITYTTTAVDAKDNGTVAQSFTIPSSAFTSSTNVIAVEIHQQRANSPDMAFDLELVGNTTTPPPVEQYTLALNVAGSGTVSKNPNQATYTSGSKVTLTATPASGYQFAGWSGDASGTVNPLTVTMDGNKAITATFTAIQAQYSLSVSTSGTGTVTKEPNQTTYTAGSTVRLTATPASGYQFTSWSGDASGNTNPLTVTMDRNKAITATFTAVQDQASPTVLSINRHNPTTETTNATSVAFQATFSEQVTGVDAGDFTITPSGSVSGTVTTAVAVGTAGTTYEVSVGSITGTGTLRLDLKDRRTGIIDMAGNPISGGYTSGQAYTIEQANPPGEEPKVLYHEGFESGSGFAGMHLQSSTTYGFKVVDSPTFSGSKVGRFELRKGDAEAASGARTEVLFTEELAQETTWHSFAAYFPSIEYANDTLSYEVYNQWHQGSTWGSPMLQLRIKDGRIYLNRRSTTVASVEYFLGQQPKDRWVKFVIHLKQHTKDGFMKIWVDGQLSLSITGETMFPDKDPVPYGRWKMGVYKPDWNNGGTYKPSSTTVRVWYVDEVKIGNAASTYGIMEPVGNNISVLSQQTTNSQPLRHNGYETVVDQNGQYKVYPTLAKRGVPIAVITSDKEATEAFVTDTAGRTLYTARFTGIFSIETAYLPSGLYFITLFGKQQSKKYKFIVTD